MGWKDLVARLIHFGRRVPRRVSFVRLLLGQGPRVLLSSGRWIAIALRSLVAIPLVLLVGVHGSHRWSRSIRSLLRVGRCIDGDWQGRLWRALRLAGLLFNLPLFTFLLVLRHVEDPMGESTAVPKSTSTELGKVFALYRLVVTFRGTG